MIAPAPGLYRSGLTDSSRWAAFDLRPGDIVISTPSKCGTTWMQMICALLIFRSADLPAPLTSLSPWLDMRLCPPADVRRRLEDQTHRRFIKTHTPLDGLPRVDGVSYVVVGRDPRDVAVSTDHHRANLNRDRIESMLPPARTPTIRPDDQRERLLQWIRDDRSPATNLDSLRAVVEHLAGAWSRRHDPAVVLLHFADLGRDLEGQMRTLAGRLDMAVPETRWPALVDAATFERMRERAADLVPDERLGLFTDRPAFFRCGRSNQWRGILTGRDLDEYQRRLHSLAPQDCARWLEAGG